MGVSIVVIVIVAGIVIADELDDNANSSLILFYDTEDAN
jgi:hypothetical protein